MKISPSRGLVTGALLTLPLALPQAQDVSALFLFKAAWYRQADAGEPALLAPSDGPFDFYAQAHLSDEFLSDPDALDWITGMTLRTPSGRTEGMQFDGLGTFWFGADAVSSSSLNTRYGAGTYRFTLSSILTGNSIFTIGLGADDYPPAPQVINFTAGQAIDPTAEFALQWTEFTGGGDRQIWLEIEDADGEFVFSAGPLPGTDLQALIPADTFEPARDYFAQLTFTRYTQANDATVPALYTAFEAYNWVPLRTSAGGAPAPSSFTAWQRLANGDLELTIACTPGRPLTVQGVASLGSPWQDITSLTPDVSPVKVVVAMTTLGQRRILRAMQQ
jgi:hypothetical protein